MASYDNTEHSGNDSRNRSRGGSVGSSRKNGYGGGVALSDGGSNYTPRNRRQTLRDSSYHDLSNWRNGPGPAAGSSFNRSNTSSTPVGGLVQSYGMSQAQAESYGTQVFDSPERGLRGRDQLMVQQPDVFIAGAPVSISPSAQAMLAAGPINVFITTERESVDANPNRPWFLHSYVSGSANEAEWNGIVLPYITTLTFTVDSTTDCHYLANILASGENPNLFKAITKIAFPGFHWFTGVQHNRRHHPAMEMANTLPNLAQIALRLHTAGITVSCYSEREMVAIEAHDPERAKARKVMHLQDIIAKYELSALFSCRALRHVRIEYIDCGMTRFFTRVGNAGVVLRDIQTFISNGFFGVGLNVLVELVRVDG